MRLNGPFGAGSCTAGWIKLAEELEQTEAFLAAIVDEEQPRKPAKRKSRRSGLSGPAAKVYLLLEGGGFICTGAHKRHN